MLHGLVSTHLQPAFLASPSARLGTNLEDKIHAVVLFDACCDTWFSLSLARFFWSAWLPQQETVKLSGGYPRQRRLLAFR